MEYIKEICDAIIESGAKSVALQMPDSMFGDAADFCEKLEFILSDVH
jgi:hypothetical protein